MIEIPIVLISSLSSGLFGFFFARTHGKKTKQLKLQTEIFIGNQAYVQRISNGKW